MIYNLHMLALQAIETAFYNLDLYIKGHIRSETNGDIYTP